MILLVQLCINLLIIGIVVAQTPYIRIYTDTNIPSLVKISVPLSHTTDPEILGSQLLSIDLTSPSDHGDISFSDYILPYVEPASYSGAVTFYYILLKKNLGNNPNSFAIILSIIGSRPNIDYPTDTAHGGNIWHKLDIGFPARSTNYRGTLILTAKAYHNSPLPPLANSGRLDAVLLYNNQTEILATSTTIEDGFREATQSITEIEFINGFQHSFLLGALQEELEAICTNNYRSVHTGLDHLQQSLLEVSLIYLDDITNISYIGSGGNNTPMWLEASIGRYNMSCTLCASIDNQLNPYTNLFPVLVVGQLLPPEFIYPLRNKDKLYINVWDQNTSIVPVIWTSDPPGQGGPLNDIRHPFDFIPNTTNLGAQILFLDSSMRLTNAISTQLLKF